MKPTSKTTALVLLARCFVAGGVAAVLSVVALRYVPIPFLWVSLCWTAFFVFITLSTKKSKPFWFNLAFGFLGLGAVEALSWASSKEQVELRYDGDEMGGYREHDEVLGYAPVSAKKVVSRRFANDELLYEVTYTIADNGLRVAPRAQASKRSEGIAFFGGSFTFGEGVEDDETLVFRTGMYSGRPVYNFGFHGYGAHHMLAALEHGIVDEIVNASTSVAVYQSIPHHVARSARRMRWDCRGPRYYLNDDGSVVPGARFEDVDPRREATFFQDIAGHLRSQLRRSYSYKKFGGDLLESTQAEIDLYVGIVLRARDAFLRRAPHGTFHVILWDTNPSSWRVRKILDGLESHMEIHRVSTIIPDLHENPSHYVYDHDFHPRALAHDRIANYVVKNILTD